MAQNQGEAREVEQRWAPWRARASSGTQLTVSPPPPPTILKQPRRTLVGLVAASAGAFPSATPPPPRANANLVAPWEGADDEKEDDVTDVYAEKVTLVFKRDGVGDDETTRELPRPTLQRVPDPPSAAARSSRPPPLPPRAATATGGLAGPGSSLPLGFDVLSASLAAASLPPHDFAAALVRANVARAAPLLRVPSFRVGAALTAAAMVGLMAFALKPAQGKILVDARDPHGAPVDRLEVVLDGRRTPCYAAPCSVPSGKGLHEVKVVAEGYEVPATQAVAVAPGESTAAHFIVTSSGEPGIEGIDPQDGVKLAADSDRQPIAFEDTPAIQADPAPLEAKSTAAPVLAAPTRIARAMPAPAYPAPAAPAAKASPARTGGGGAREGFLNINSIPASTCFVDGRSLGSTPRLRVSVSAGSHTVKFRDPERGSTKTVVVTVGTGETRLAVTRLR